MLVLDASDGVQACLTADGFRPLADDLGAPPLWWSEVVSGLHELRWRRAITRDLADAAIARLRRAPVRERTFAHRRFEASGPDRAVIVPRPTA